MSSPSFTRIGTATQYDSAVRNISARQTALSNLQENLTAGKRVLRASDDPVAAAQAERALTRIGRIQTEQRALDVQRNAVAQAEASLGDAVGLVQQMRELVVSAGNGGHVASDRKTIAGQLQSLRDQLLSVSNRTDTSGVPLLAALGSSAVPFGAGSSFAGLPGQAGGSGVSIPGALDGHAAFQLPPATPAGPETSLFDAIDAAIAGIGSAPDSTAAAAAVSQALGDMDQGMERLQAVRGYAGELLNRADRITGDQEQRSIQLEADRSRAEDLDMIQGISNFQNQQVGYQAALQSYAMVQKLSLFNFIS